MKTFKLFILTLISFLMISCASTNSLTYQRVYEEDNISYILSTYYPQLYRYYDEGVLRVNSVKEVVLEGNIIDYKINYKFVRRYYYNNQSEMAIVLHEHFPELYEMYINGIVEINSIYKYVDRSTGKIKYHVSYRNIFDVYYNTYPDTRYRGYYRPRYRPTPPPPRHRITPQPPKPRPETRPQPQPAPRNNNNNNQRSNSGGNHSGGGRR